MVVNVTSNDQGSKGHELNGPGICVFFEMIFLRIVPW